MGSSSRKKIIVVSLDQTSKKGCDRFDRSGTGRGSLCSHDQVTVGEELKLSIHYDLNFHVTFEVSVQLSPRGDLSLSGCH